MYTRTPGPTTNYPCPLCVRNATSRGVSYLCNCCSGWVHSKGSGPQNAAVYRRIKDWACISCSSPPTLPTPQPLPPPIPIQAVDKNPSRSCYSTQMSWFHRSLPTRGETVRHQTVPANPDHLHPDSLLFVSTGFLPRVSSQRLN